MTEDNDICKTGIDALDKIMGGGFPKGRVFLISGSSGTGKTIMGMQFLFNGAKKFNERGLQISFAESKENLLKDMEKFKFYDKKFIKSGKIIVTDLENLIWREGLDSSNPQDVLDLIEKTIRENGIKRLVIDSISAIGEAMNKPSDIREFIFRLGILLRRTKCTTLMISEIPPQKMVYSVYGIEEFVSDGVILLNELERENELVRYLYVIKMRGMNHSRTKYILKITEEGITLIPVIKTGRK